MDLNALAAFLQAGGPAMWAIAALSVLTATLVMWKIWRLARAGVWSSAPDAALAVWAAGDRRALEQVSGKGLLARLTRLAIQSRLDPALGEKAAREEVTVAAKSMIADVRGGLRALELIVTIAPLLGLFGTVLGMIEAFQTLQAAGSRADPSALAGGIWEALLTTAAGMGVAIPAAMALSWFDGTAERFQTRLEEVATKVFTRGPASE
ncbi:MAG: MotA/TolQ/ExbB proton channel family protein [Rhodobacteraceae bacterium]|jgi:biopolymer transport protein ExbB|nr:MotA/TolQ/ExbB proton channel family protein [Paracoccaceae bacterium]